MRSFNHGLLGGIKRTLHVHDTGGTVPLTSGPSVAVMPFINRSSDPENEYFSDGITEDIINALTQLEGLHVAARTSSFAFKGKSPDIAEVGARLKVATVLEGSVRRAGNRLRVTAQLVNVSDGYDIWSERFDREKEDVFEIQDEIATMIADHLKVTLDSASDEPLVTAPTKNLEAYQLYVKGRALLYQRGLGIPRALECFKQAVALDSNYALAWAGMADAHTTRGYYGFVPPDQSMPNAKAAATQATQLDPSLAEAHNAMAVATLLHDRDWATAEREFRRALDLNPRYIQARCWYGFFYLQLTAGRLDEGAAEAAKAIDIDPLSGYTHALHGLALGTAGHYEAALEESLAAVEHDPDSFLAHWILQCSYHWVERFPDSIEASTTALTISGRHPWALAALASTYADWGKHTEARGVHDELLARTAREYVSPAVLAWSSTAVDEMDQAMVFAQRAYDDRDPFLSFASHWPDFGRLRSDPRFQALLREMNFPTTE